MFFNITPFLVNRRLLSLEWSQHIAAFLASAFLVSIPVFFEAPLVRYAPWLSLILTVGWLALSRQLLEKPNSQIWGSLLWGFSLTWLCGSIYWGWLRLEPMWHLPIEAIALPWAIWAIRKAQASYGVGAYFYLGSLLGTAITDLYFYLTDLVPHWQMIMQVETDINLVRAILQDALAQVQTVWGIAWAVGLGLGLIWVSVQAMRSPQAHTWAFAGAVVSTIFVDSIFAVVAYWA